MAARLPKCPDWLKIGLLLVFALVLVVSLIQDIVIVESPPPWDNRNRYHPNATRWMATTVRKDTSPLSTRARPVTILTSTNEAYLDFCDNWLESVKRCGITGRIVIYAEDNASAVYLRSRTDINITVRTSDDVHVNSSFLLFGTDDYIRMVNKRPVYIETILREGSDVMFSDLDVVFLENPLTHCTDDFDLHVVEQRHNDYIYLIAPDWLEMNLGFTYFSATNATIELVRKWNQMLVDSPKIPDQDMLNSILVNKSVRDKMKINVLDYRQFPSGLQYFDDSWRKKHSGVVVVHNTWCKGHDPKIDRFKRVGLWYV